MTPQRRLRVARRAAVVLCLLWSGAISGSAFAFDTAWHVQATARALQDRGFSPASTSLVHLGNFAPDFFITIAQDRMRLEAQKVLSDARFALLPTWARPQRVEPVVRGAAALLHFDNLGGSLNANNRFGVIFDRLANNTALVLVQLHRDSSLGDEVRARLVLMALGTSLHAVQDFYSHTNWSHIEFEPLGFLAQPAPTWYEALDVLGAAPRGLPFRLQAGIFPEAGVIPLTAEGGPMTHDYMHHDNSQMTSEGITRTPWHEVGPVPASAGADLHHGRAATVAADASAEWLDRLLLDEGVREAIKESHQYTRPRLIARSPGVMTLEAAWRLSCLSNHWDGPDPPPEQQANCKRHLRGLAVRLIPSIVTGEANLLPNALNDVWKQYLDAQIMDRITAGVGDGAGGYAFDDDPP